MAKDELSPHSRPFSPFPSALHASTPLPLEIGP